MWSYAVLLAASSVIFTLAERRWPRCSQPVLRRSWGWDVALLVFNAEVMGALVAIGLVFVLPYSTVIRFRTWLPLDWLAGRSAVAQMLALLLVKDFLQW
ncbi:MAG: hypothetical protein NTV70_03660 [Acidobacteria bacterium]|nr:hypothetical protein [Acidobacteriota bacterium]